MISSRLPNPIDGRPGYGCLRGSRVRRAASQASRRPQLDDDEQREAEPLGELECFKE
jgi:hypothetical protein